MAPAVAVPRGTASASYDDDYYSTSYGYEPAEYNYNYGKTYNRKPYGKISYTNNSFNRKSGKSKSDQVSSNSYYGWYPYSGGGQYGQGGQYGSRSDSYGSYDGYGGGGQKCCCNSNNNNLATLGAIGLGFLALNGQLQNIINAINGRRRRKRDTDDDETANGKMMARFNFAKSLVTVRKKVALAYQPLGELLTQGLQSTFVAYFTIYISMSPYTSH